MNQVTLTNKRPDTQLQIAVTVENGALSLAIQEGRPEPWKFSDGRTVTVLRDVKEAEVILLTPDELEHIAARLLQIAQDSRVVTDPVRWAFALEKNTALEENP